MKELDLFKELPRLSGNLKFVTEDLYNPTLYFFEDEWFVSWQNVYEGDTLLSFSGNTPEEAIEKAYKWYKDNEK